MASYVIGELGGINPFLVREPNVPNTPKHKTQHVQPVQPVHPTYDSQGRTPRYQERPSNYRPLDVRI